MANYGGIASGIRTGLALGAAFQEGAERRRQRSYEDDLAKAGAGLSDVSDTPKQPVAPRVAQANRVESDSGAGTGKQPDAGLTPVPIPNAGAQAPIPDKTYSVEGAAGLAPDAQPQMQSSGDQLASAGKPVDYLGDSDFGRAIDSLGRQYQVAIKHGRSDDAMRFLLQKEKMSDVYRSKAFDAADQRFKVTGDPSVYASFANRYLPPGTQFNSIEQSQAKGSDGSVVPMFYVTGQDTVTGKEFQQAFTQSEFGSMLNNLRDPNTARALAAKEAERTFAWAQKSRELAEKHRYDMERDAANRKPDAFNLSDGQTRFVRDGDGQYKPVAVGSGAGGSLPKEIQTNMKDFRSFAMKGYNDLDDQGRADLTKQVAAGENIFLMNRNRPEGKNLTAGNMATLTQNLISGQVPLTYMKDKNGNYSIVAQHEGMAVIVPQSVVPPEKLQAIREKIKAGQGTSAKSDASGLVTPGNIDLDSRPVVKNKDGSISTIKSMSIGVDGKEVLIPTISPDGKVLSKEEAIELYERTGKHLGEFSSSAAATAYAKKLSQRQGKAYGDDKKWTPPAKGVERRPAKPAAQRPERPLPGLTPIDMKKGEAVDVAREGTRKARESLAAVRRTAVGTKGSPADREAYRNRLEAAEAKVADALRAEQEKERAWARTAEKTYRN